MFNIDFNFIVFMLVIEKVYLDFCYLMMGFYFCYVDVNVKQILVIIYEWFFCYIFIVVGEIGIDLYWDKIFKVE